MLAPSLSRRRSRGALCAAAERQWPRGRGPRVVQELLDGARIAPAHYRKAQKAWLDQAAQLQRRLNRMRARALLSSLQSDRQEHAHGRQSTG